MSTITKISASDLRKAADDGTLNKLVRELRAAGRIDELDELRDEVEELYEQRPRDFRLSELAGELSQRAIARAHVLSAEEKAERKAEHRAARDYYLQRREWEAMPAGEFWRAVEAAVGTDCPGDTDRPHEIAGFGVRSGLTWRCRRCGFEGDLEPVLAKEWRDD